MPVFLYVCGSGTVIILFLALRDTWRWRQGKSLIRGGQLVSRWVSALILVALTILILMGSLRKDIREFAYGWLAVLILVTMLALVALVDLYQVAKTQQRRRRELLKELGRAMEETLRQAKPPESKGKPP